MRPQVTIYTDGACRGNPGPGGWGAILLFGDTRKELSGGAAATTNNRMELQAVISALAALKKPCQVALFTDSQYVMFGATKWLTGWQQRGWRKADKSPVENMDLWQALLPLLQIHSISWTWVRGHTGDPLNEAADALARQAIG